MSDVIATPDGLNGVAEVLDSLSDESLVAFYKMSYADACGREPGAAGSCGLAAGLLYKRGLLAAADAAIGVKVDVIDGDAT